MTDFEQARTKMVDCQVRPSDVTSHALISALLSVQREEFVPDGQRELAYIDEDLPLEVPGRYLMEPAPFARLVQLADVQEDDFVLVIGAGRGYSAAVLSLLASSVIAIEENLELAAMAEATLMKLGFDNTAVVAAPFASGYPKEAPYDVIFIDGAVDEVPDILLSQLQDHGRLVAVEGTGNSAVAKLYKRINDIVGRQEAMNCSVKALPGFEKEASFVF